MIDRELDDPRQFIIIGADAVKGYKGRNLCIVKAFTAEEALKQAKDHFLGTSFRPERVMED